MPLSHVSFNVEKLQGYSVVTFPKEIGMSGMGDLHNAIGAVLEELAAKKAPACLVDLTALNYMGSSLVACVVRIWKAVRAQNGNMVVVASSEGIQDVLIATGLAKVWTIVKTKDAGVHALGFSPAAKVAKRERRLLIFVAPIALVAGGIFLTIKVIPQLSNIGRPSEVFIYSVIGLSIVAALVSSIRDSGWRRMFSLGVLVSGLVLLGSCPMLLKPPEPVNRVIFSSSSAPKTNDDEAIEAGPLDVTLRAHPIDAKPKATLPASTANESLTTEPLPATVDTASAVDKAPSTDGDLPPVDGGSKSSPLPVDPAAEQPKPIGDQDSTLDKADPTSDSSEPGATIN